MSSFQRFVRLCAGRTGQLLNLHSLGNDAGVSHTTARQWISVLEASYVVFLLPPYHANIGKRLIKSPKLYFYDVGLAAYLLGIENSRQIATHPLRGGLFENLVILEALKYRFNQAKRSNLFFYRDSNGNEVDLIYALADQLLAVEIKAGETISRQFFTSLIMLQRLLPQQMAGGILVYGGNTQQIRDQIRVTVPRAFIHVLEKMEAELIEGC